MTGQLGTAASELGQIELGSPGVPGSTNGSMYDTLSFSDVLSADGGSTTFTSRLGILLSQLGNIQLGHAFSLDPGLSDHLVFSDTMLAIQTFIVSYSDTLAFSGGGFSPDNTIHLTFSDTLTFNDSFPALMADTLTFTDTFTETRYRIGVFSDTLTFTDTFTENWQGGRNLGDSLTLVDRFTYNEVKNLNFSDSFTFTDSNTGNLVFPLSDTLTFTDSFTYTYAHRLVPDILTFGDYFTLNQITYWKMADQLVLFEPGFQLDMYYRLTLSDTMTFTDHMVGNAVIPLVPDHLTFTESWVGVESSSIIDTLTLTDSSKYNRVFNVALSTDYINFSDRFTNNLVNSVSFSDGLNFIDKPTIAYVWSGSFSDTLSFSEILVRQIHETVFDDTLAFTDSLTHVKIGRGIFSDTFVFTDTFAIQHTTKHSLQDYVVFNGQFALKVKGTQNNGGGIAPSPPISGNPAYQPPTVPYGVSNIYQAVTIIGTQNTIVLPPPEFNDYVQNQSKVIMQRSMTGLFRSYIKKTARQKLNWRFIIPKYKADELRAFVLVEVENPLTLIDWEGNVWYVKLLSDTVEMAETGRWGGPILGGDRNEVTLEFTGVKYV